MNIPHPPFVPISQISLSTEQNLHFSTCATDLIMDNTDLIADVSERISTLLPEIKKAQEEVEACIDFSTTFETYDRTSLERLAILKHKLRDMHSASSALAGPLEDLVNLKGNELLDIIAQNMPFLQSMIAETARDTLLGCATFKAALKARSVFVDKWDDQDPVGNLRSRLPELQASNSEVYSTLVDANQLRTVKAHGLDKQLKDVIMPTVDQVRAGFNKSLDNQGILDIQEACKLGKKLASNTFSAESFFDKESDIGAGQRFVDWRLLTREFDQKIADIHINSHKTTRYVPGSRVSDRSFASPSAVTQEKKLDVKGPIELKGTLTNELPVELEGNSMDPCASELEDPFTNSSIVNQFRETHISEDDSKVRGVSELEGHSTQDQPSEPLCTATVGGPLWMTLPDFEGWGSS